MKLTHKHTRIKKKKSIFSSNCYQIQIPRRITAIKNPKKKKVLHTHIQPTSYKSIHLFHWVPTSEFQHRSDPIHTQRNKKQINKSIFNIQNEITDLLPQKINEKKKEDDLPEKGSNLTGRKSGKQWEDGGDDD